LISCGNWNDEKPDQYIARVHEQYLLEEDLEEVAIASAVGMDSASLREKAINKWVLNRLLVRNALRNLPEEKVEEIDALVEDYMTELYTQTYLQEITMQQLDTVIDTTAISNYYNKRKDQYILNEDLVKFRYLAVPRDYENFKDLKKKFRQFDEESRYYLDSLSLTFNSYFFNDSIWVRKADLFKRVQPLSAANESQYVRENADFEIEDSMARYLVSIKKILPRGEQAPLVYVSPVIRQVILNKRKLDFIAELKNDLVQDAIQRGNAEISND
jgi:hypothetical protein